MPKALLRLHSSWSATCVALLLLGIAGPVAAAPGDGFRAGAAAVPIDPPQLPVLQNGGFLQRTADQVTQPLFARALAVADGQERIALCVVDSCMLSRELCDAVKDEVAARTGIGTDRILISATHTHSAPALMRCLGCPADPDYPTFLVPRLVACLEQAVASLRPAQAGWAVIDAGRYTNCRRWIFLPHKMGQDPFGQTTVRAMMHPGYVNPATAGPAGPIDPDLTVLSIRDLQGRPLALLGNFSMHYYGAPGLSSDFTGRVCELLESSLGDSADATSPFVAVMSQGTSGDLHFMDYSRPAAEQPFRGKPDGFARYCRELSDLIGAAVAQIRHRRDVTVAMAEARLRLARRVPGAERLAWAEQVAAEIEGVPANRPQVYAAEALWIRDHPEAELKLQAVRIGELGITAMPNEVYGITGLKLKLHSPLQPTMNIELANGGAGYIPPPEQHALGGYTTWPARTAGLAVEAEPKIVETVLGLLEQVAERPRRTPSLKRGSYVARALAGRPLAYWSMDPHSGARVLDLTDSGHDASLEPGYALFLPGPSGGEFTLTERGNRAVHFADGRLRARLAELGDRYSVTFWFWNALPHDARPVTGYLFSRGQDGSSEGDHLGIDGRAEHRGRLLFYNGDTRRETLVGQTVLQLRTWYHVALVRDGARVRAYLNGSAEPELDGTVAVTRPAESEVFLGGRSDRLFGWEGKIDEIAVFDRALTASELKRLR